MFAKKNILLFTTHCIALTGILIMTYAKHKYFLVPKITTLFFPRFPRALFLRYLLFYISTAVQSHRNDFTFTLSYSWLHGE